MQLIDQIVLTLFCIEKRVPLRAKKQKLEKTIFVDIKTNNYLLKISINQKFRRFT
jgi:hypothetical protein